MRKLFLLFALLVLPTSLLAQQDIRDRGRGRDRDESWRERRSYYRQPNLFEITPFGGYRWGGTIYADRTDLFGQDVEVSDSGSLGVNFGIPLGGTNMKLELMISRQDTHLDAAGGLFTPSDRLADIDITHYHAGVQIPFGESYSAVPFLIVSAGVASLDPQLPGLSADNRFSASAGLGVKVPLNRNIGLRLEGRGYFTSLGGDQYDDCYRCYDDYNHDLYQGEASIGLVVSF